MTLEHYKAQEETARQFKELKAELQQAISERDAARLLCERLQAQADEMRGGRAITSAEQLAELIDGVRCFHDLGAELIAEAVFEQLPDHIPDTTKMIEDSTVKNSLSVAAPSSPAAEPAPERVSAPRDRIQIALAAVQNAMEDAYNTAYQNCCGRGIGQCCGDREPAWGDADQAIMDALAPAQRELSARLAVPTPTSGDSHD